MERGWLGAATQTVLWSLAFFVASLPLSAQQLAATPPMGWNSWNWFAGKVTDADIRRAADLIVSSGMRDAGYIYVNIDDTWEGSRDAQGRSAGLFPMGRRGRSSQCHGPSARSGRDLCSRGYLPSY